MILLDTSVLSAVLRRRQPGPEERRIGGRLQGLLNGGARIHVPGLVVQELLSGIREADRFEQIKAVLLRGYPILTASIGDHVLAAEIVNKCRRRGVAVSSGDALIAALAVNARGTLFTVDEDFQRVAKLVPLKLLES